MELKKDENLIINESDKGGACVVMGREFYKQKMLNIVNDRNTHKELEKNFDNEIFNKIVKLAKDHKHELTDKEIKHLTQFNHQPSKLYGLPKIYKSEQIKKAGQENPSKYIEVHQPDDLPMRPIVTGPNCVTNRLSNFLDVLLKSFLKHVKSYVRDDIDFLNKVPKNTTESKVLLTLDVTNMYTNIDNNLGREAIEFWLDNHPECIPRNVPKDFNLKAVNIVLEFNTFTFNDRTFLQMKGVSMGTKCAPTYVTLVMAYLEIKLYNIIGEKYGEEIKQQFIRDWLRYLDDCFLDWDEKIDTVSNLLNVLQNLHPSVELEHCARKTAVDYLEITVKVKHDKTAITDLYQKPTDSQQHVPFNSCHLSHTKRNIPFNLSRHICTIVDEEQTKFERLSKLQNTLTKQGYPRKLAAKGVEEALKIPKEQLRKEKQNTQNEDKILTFVSTHNPTNPSMFKIIKESIAILDACPKMKRGLQNFKLINSKRQRPSLKKLLTHPKFSDKEKGSSTTTVNHCKDKRCKACDVLHTCNEVKFNKSSENVKIKTNMEDGTNSILERLVTLDLEFAYISNK